MVSPAISSAVSAGITARRRRATSGAFTGGVSLFLAKLAAGTATKVAFVGDSTSDNTSNAGGLYTRFNNVAKGARYGRWANATALDYGVNGATSTSWLAGVGAKSLTALITAAPDLVMLCLGINDRRTQSVSTTQLGTNLRSILASIFAGIPNVCVVVHEPQAFLITGAGGYITVGTGQAGTDELRTVYRALAGYHPRLVVCPIQDVMGGDIVWSATNSPGGNKAFKWPSTILSGSGQTALTTTSGWINADGIHPQPPLGYAARMDIFTYLYGAEQPLDAAAAASAQAGSYYSPFIAYPRAVELTDYWQEIRKGYMTGATAAQGYVDFDCENDAGEADSASRLQVAKWDIVIGETGAAEVMTNFNLTAQSATLTRMWQAGYPAATLPAGRVKFYRHKYLRDATVQSYMQNAAYTWKRWGNVQQGGSNYIVLESMTAAIITQYGWETYTKDWTLANGDIMVIVNGDGTNEVLTLAGCTFGVNGVNQKQVQNGTFSGNSASRVGKRFAVFGAHA